MMEFKPDVQLFGTAGLCFDKDIFMRPDFNVDDFMREYQCSGDANLETLRDHLGVYLKILRSAMIDLINRDYADFVNLSTNLTGLDSLIQALTVPLGQLREEVLSVSQLLESASTGILTDLQKQRTIHKYKKKLATLSDIASRLDNLEDLIHQSGFENGEFKKKTDGGNSALTENTRAGDPEEAEHLEPGLSNLCLEVCSEEELLDRLAAELSYLNYLASTCEGTKLINIYQPRITRIQSAVEAGIERNLKGGLGYSSCEAGTEPAGAATQMPLLRRTLIACTVMDSAAVAEEVVRQLLAPKIKELLSEASLRSNPRGVAGLLSALLSFISSSLAPLLLLTVPRRIQNSACAEEVLGFRFIEHSVFPEAITALSAIPDFYSPANPTAFHQRYLQCIDFLESLERLLVTKERVDGFRTLTSYHKFMEQWNLAVYFQIRNQEIGQVVESSLCEESGLRLLLNSEVSASAATQQGLSAPPPQSSNSAPLLGSTRGVLHGITQCWLPEVFLPPLLHRFWKLTLLVLARHRTWLSSTLDRMQQGDTTLYSSTSYALTKSGSSGPPKPSSSPRRRPTNTVELAVYLLADLALLRTSITALYSTSCEEHLRHVPDQLKDMIRNTLSGESAQLGRFEQSLLSLTAQDVSRAMAAALQPVTDTPRLYRRTNRSAPSQPQQYVMAVLQPLQQLHAVAAARLPTHQLQSCYEAVCAAVAKQYYTLTSEVLANVSKTEESLRRLKRARGNTAVTSPQGAGLTDEDKIREQLHRDVKHFGEQLRALGVATQEVAEFVQLSDTVRDARTAASALQITASASSACTPHNTAAASAET